MRVVLLRHASRSVQSVDDSSLSTLGVAQARELAEATLRGDLPSPTRLIGSPKRRSRETLQPLASALGLRLEIDERVDERRNGESMSVFAARVRAFIVSFTQGQDVVFVCSHLDWLECAMVAIPSDALDTDQADSWTNCEWRAFDVKDGLWSQVSNGAISATRTGDSL